MDLKFCLLNFSKGSPREPVPFNYTKLPARGPHKEAVPLPSYVFSKFGLMLVDSYVKFE